MLLLCRGDNMLGDKIRDLRKQNHWKQDELAEKLNKEFGLKIDRAMVSKWETGYQTPVIYTISCLAKLFNVSIDYLNGNSDNVNLEQTKLILSEKERTVILAYRSRPEMQTAVDKLLGIDDEVYITKIAARNGDNGVISLTRDQINEIKNAPDVPKDL